MRKAQSTLEYLLILTGALLALFYAVRSGGPVNTGMNTYFDGMEAALTDVSSEFAADAAS